MFFKRSYLRGINYEWKCPCAIAWKYRTDIEARRYGLAELLSIRTHSMVLLEQGRRAKRCYLVWWLIGSLSITRPLRGTISSGITDTERTALRSEISELLHHRMSRYGSATTPRGRFKWFAFANLDPAVITCSVFRPELDTVVAADLTNSTHRIWSQEKLLPSYIRNSYSNFSRGHFLKIYVLSGCIEKTLKSPFQYVVTKYG